MKINDNGFTERVATPSVPGSKVESTSLGQPQKNSSAAEAGDNLQLSGFAARLNSGLSADAASRAARVSQLAKAVSNGTFQIDSSRVASALTSEALRSNG
jgi:flagellar biosynthesis anti-sigma factor FlgM